MSRTGAFLPCTVVVLVALLAASCRAAVSSSSALRKESNGKHRDTAPPEEGKVQRIVFAHRHGARSPMMDIDGSCGTEMCGELNDVGKEMLFSFGKYLREHYGDILPSTYDLNQIKITADTVDRTIQSANALLRGLFSFNASYTPYSAVQTENYDDSVLLPYSAFPPYRFHKNAIMSNYSQYVVSKYITHPSDPSEQVFTKSQLMAVVRELNSSMLTLICGQDLYLCASFVDDFLDCMKVLGRLHHYPLGQQLLPAMDRFHTIYRRLLEYSYDAEVLGDRFYEEAGFPGAALALEMAGEAAAPLGKGQTPMVEWSGHDTTVMPLYVAMGNTTFTYPPFGTAVLFEVFSRNGSNWLRAKVGSPDQTPGSNHSYSFTSFQVTCTSDNGTVYTAQENGCPVSDFTRWIWTRANPSPLGNCYVRSEDLELGSCGYNATAIDVEASAACRRYRRRCPFTACGDGSHMRPDLTCRKN